MGEAPIRGPWEPAHASWISPPFPIAGQPAAEP